MIGKKKCNETKPLARKWNNCGAGLASMIWRAVGEDAEVGPHQSVTGVPLAPQARFIPSPQPSDIFLPILHLHLHLHPRPEDFIHPPRVVPLRNRTSDLHCISILCRCCRSFSTFSIIPSISQQRQPPGSCPVNSVPAPSRVVR